MFALERKSEGPTTTQEEPRISLLIPRGGSVTLFVGEGITAFPSHLKRRRSPREARKELKVSCHHFKRPLMSQHTPDTPDSPALTRRSHQGPTQNTMAGVTALWRHDRKPPIPMVNLTGSLTLLFRLERRADLHGSTETRPDSPVDTPEELQGSCHHFKRPLTSQCTPDTPDSPALTRRSPRGPT